MDVDALRKQLAAALASHGEIELALLFGSRARGTAGPASDVDIAVIGRAIDTIGLAIELTDAIGTEVDVVDISNDPPFALLLALLKDGRKVYEGHPGAYGRFLSHTLLVLETDLPNWQMMQRAFVQRVAERGILGDNNG